MGELEAACQQCELGSADLAKAAKQLERAATALRKAAAEGNDAKITSAISDVGAALDVIRLKADGALRSWPFTTSQIEEYLASKYERELIEAGRSEGIEVTRLDDRLMAFPAVIQVVPSQRAVRIDRVRHPSIRPSRIIGFIKSQRKVPGAKPQVFIETLHNAYKRAKAVSPSGATLMDLFDILTSHPEWKRMYSRADFERDVFLLDNSDVRRTKSGAKLSFSGSTGAKGGVKAFVVRPPNGMPKTYYGIRFQESET